MANYEQKWRTNYFRVKNIELFENAINEISCKVIKKRNKCGEISSVMLLNDGTGETDYYTIHDEEEKFDWAKIAKTHLCEGEVIVFNLIGSEKMRYLTGIAEAFTYDGVTLTVTFDSLYEELKDSGYENVTDCSY